jgi:hypothetical protein
MAAKSFTGSYGILANSQGVDRMRGHGGDADGGAVRRGLGHGVGADVAAAAGRFSMITVPSESFTRSASTRAVTSIGPAGRVGDDEADRARLATRRRARPCGGRAEERGSVFCVSCPALSQVRRKGCAGIG